MKRAIRVLAICDLVLAIAFTPLALLRLNESSLGSYLAICGSPGRCPFPLSILSHAPDAVFIIAVIILLALLSAGFTLSLVVTTLSMVLHNRLGSRGWFAVFVILTSILALSPGPLFAGVFPLGRAYALLFVLAALSSLVALVSTFFLGEGDERS